MARTHKVDIVIEAQNNAEKVLTSIQKSIDNLTQSIVRSNLAMAENINRVSDSVDSIKNSFNKVSTSAEKVSQNTKKIHYDWRGLVWTIVRAEIVFRAIMRIVSSLKDYFGSMLDTLDEYQMSLLQLSAIQTTLLQGTVKGTGDLENLFNRMYSINQSVYQTLLKMSAQTPLTTEQLLRLYRSWLAYGQVVDLSNEKMRKGLLAVANAIYMMSGGFQVNRQLVQETRGLITQTSLAYSDLARFIIRSGLASKEQLQTWAKQNVLLEKMSEKLSGFVIASDRSLETLQGLGTTFESVWKQQVIENFDKAYDSTRAFLKVVLQSKTVIQGLGNAIRVSANAFRYLSMWILGVIGTIRTLLGLIRMAVDGLMTLLTYPLKWAGKGLLELSKSVRSLAEGFKWTDKVKSKIEGVSDALFNFGKSLIHTKYISNDFWKGRFKEGWDETLDFLENIGNTINSIYHPEKYVTPTKSLDEQGEKLKDFYTLLQSFASSGSQIADEIDQNLTKIGDSFKENFGIKSLDVFVKTRDYLSSLQSGIFSFIDAIAKKGKEAKLPLWDSFTEGLKQVAEGKLKLSDFVGSLKELAKSGKISKGVLDLMGQATLAVAQKVDYLHDRQKKLTDSEKNITNVVLKETKDKLSNLEGSFKSLGAEVERFGIPTTTLEAKLKNVDIQFYSLQNRIIKSISRFEALRESIEKASNSTKVPKELREELKKLLPVLDEHIKKEKEWLKDLPEKADKYKEYIKLIEEQRQHLFDLKESQAELDRQYKFSQISAEEYYQSVLDNLQQQKQAYEERLLFLEENSQEYISTEEKILQVEQQITDTELELQKRSDDWRAGVQKALEDYKNSLDETASGFSIATSTMTSALQGLENSLTAVFGDVMLGKLKSFQDYFMIFVNAIIAEISRLIAKLMMLKLIVPAIKKVLGKLFDIQIGKKKSTGNWIEDMASIFHQFSMSNETQSSGGVLSDIGGIMNTFGDFGILGKLGSFGGVLGKIAKPVAIGGAIAGGLGVLGDVFGGLFGGKHHPGKYGWEIKWSGIAYDPQTGKFVVTSPEVHRILRAGEKVDEKIKWGFTPEVTSYLNATVEELNTLPENIKESVIDKLKTINSQFTEITFTTHLEALREQLEAFENYMNLYYLPSLQRTFNVLLAETQTSVTSVTNASQQVSSGYRGYPSYEEWEQAVLTAKMEQLQSMYSSGNITSDLESYLNQIGGIENMTTQNLKQYIEQTSGSVSSWYEQWGQYEIPGFQHGGLVKGSKRGYIFTGLLHGAEHIVPDKEMKTLKEELSELKQLFWLLVDANANQIKYNKRSYELLLKWDITGMPQTSLT